MPFVTFREHQTEGASKSLIIMMALKHGYQMWFTYHTHFAVLFTTLKAKSGTTISTKRLADIIVYGTCVGDVNRQCINLPLLIHRHVFEKMISQLGDKMSLCSRSF